MNRARRGALMFIMAVSMVLGIPGCVSDGRLRVECRHKALMAMAVLSESYEVEVVIGKVKRTDALHAIVRANVKDEWRYYTVYGGEITRITKPDMVNEKGLSVDEYLKLIRNVIIVSRNAYEVERFNEYLRDKEFDF